MRKGRESKRGERWGIGGEKEDLEEEKDLRSRRKERD